MTEKTLRKGNEALAEGAIRAGARFFAGYPITPQNEVPEYMSAHMADAGGAFVQAESELAAINMVYGAASTGTRSMTSSSPARRAIISKLPAAAATGTITSLYWRRTRWKNWAISPN